MHNVDRHYILEDLLLERTDNTVTNSGVIKTT